MKRFSVLLFCALFCLMEGRAAINSQYNFEKGVPGFVRVIGNGEVVSSTDRFKDGRTSIRFSWKGQAALAFNNCTDIEASMKVNRSALC